VPDGRLLTWARMKLSLFITCLGDVLRPEVGRTTVRLLRRLGHEVDFPEAQTCCGQPFYNSGFADLAREQAKRMIEVFDNGQTIVAPSGSCAAMVKIEYPHLLADDERWHARATDLAARTFELADLLVNHLGVVQVGARYSGKVAYHYACHLRGLGMTTEVERLLENVDGLTYVGIDRQDQCCGFGGSFSVRYPQISTAMVTDKVNCITATGADAVVSTDAGCLMNIGGRLRRLGHKIQVLHLAELLVQQ
jgi:L-lactate dehydrogenase complex protein LldE